VGYRWGRRRSIVSFIPLNLKEGDAKVAFQQAFDRLIGRGQTLPPDEYLSLLVDSSRKGKKIGG